MEAPARKRMNVTFFVAGFGSVAARAFAAEVEQWGFVAELGPDPCDRGWTCMCSKTMRVTTHEIMLAQRELDRLSTPFGGRNEGWGVGR
jgi:hypothetical protein